jgi:hypothetical protein
MICTENKVQSNLNITNSVEIAILELAASPSRSNSDFGYSSGFGLIWIVRS